MEKSHALAIIPTYNEAGNIESIVRRVLAQDGLDVLVVDDGSPDGTGDIAERLAATDGRIHVLHRAGKLGLGAAYLEGFAYGTTAGYRYLVEIDADGSHAPESLPQMISVLENDTIRHYGGVIGSRWVPGGSVVNWPKSREFISRAGSFYARTMLGIKLRDITAGYRVYRTDVLELLDLETIQSRGYCFQIDMTRRVLDAGFEMVEVPIEFREREIGESKMSSRIVVEAMLMVTKWGLQRIFSRRSPAAVHVQG